MARGSKGTGGRGGKGSGGGASAGGIRAGAAFVELFTKDGPLVKGLKAASSKVAEWAASVAKLAAAGIAGAAVAIGAAIAHFTSRGDSIKKTSDRLGIGAETLSALGYAAEQSGSDLEGLERGLKKLQQNIFEGANGSAEMAEAFHTLGLEAKTLKDLKPEDQWLAVADALSSVENVTERNALALRAFGKTGLELIPLLLGGSRGVRDLMAEAGRVGSVVTSEQAAAAEKIGDAFGRVWSSVKNTFFSIGALLTPIAKHIEDISLVLVELIKKFRDWITASVDLSGVFGQVGEAWNAIVSQIRSGEFEASFAVLTATVEVQWTRLTTAIESAWTSMIGFLSQALNAWAFATEDVIQRVFNSIKAIEAEIGETLGVFPAGTTDSVIAQGAKDLEDIRQKYIGIAQQIDAINNQENLAADEKLNQAKAALDQLLQGIRDKDNLPFGGFDFNVKGAVGQAAGAASTRGSFNPGNAQQFFGGGGSPLQRLEKQGEEQNGLIRELIAAMKNVPLARL